MYRRQASRYETQGSVFAVQANARRNATPRNLGRSIGRRKGMRQSEERDTSGCHVNGAGEQFVTQGAISNKRHAGEIRIAAFITASFVCKSWESYLPPHGLNKWDHDLFCTCSVERLTVLSAHWSLIERPECSRPTATCTMPCRKFKHQLKPYTLHDEP